MWWKGLARYWLVWFPPLCPWSAVWISCLSASAGILGCCSSIKLFLQCQVQCAVGSWIACTPHKRICPRDWVLRDPHEILQTQDTATKIAIIFVCAHTQLLTSFLSGAKASICLRCCSESTESSQDKMASLIWSKGSFRCPRRMAAHKETVWKWSEVVLL